MKTYRELMSEVAQPKPKDEIDFKAKHEIEMLDHPESEEHQHTSEKKGRKRLADYEKGQDMSVYESVKFDGKTFKDYKTFNSDREANRFLEKNDDYGVIGAKGGKVYVAKMDDMGEAYELDESFSVFKPMSPAPGRSVSNRVQVKAFKTSDAMNTFLAKGANATQWKPTEKQGLKSGTYKMDMQRGNDGKPQRNFIKESAELSEDATLDQIRNILTKKNDGTKVIKDRSGYFHIKYKDSSHKGPYHTLKDVLRGLSESAFIAKAAAAKKADKKKFELGDKKFPVTMKKDTAKEIVGESEDNRDELTKKLFPKRTRAEMEKSDRERNRKLNQKRFMKPGKPRRSGEWNTYESEDLSEISKKTLGSYVRKASSQLDKDWEDTKSNKKGLSNRKVMNRFDGIYKARAKGANEEVELDENFKTGSLTLNDGSEVVVSKQNADLLNQMFDDLNARNKKEMMKVAMTDKDGFNEILSFAREAL